MKERIKKAIAEYDRRYSNLNTTEAAFYAADFVQLFEISAAQDPRNFHYKLADNALKAGFVIGYRKAQADQRKKKQTGGRGNA